MIDTEEKSHENDRKHHADHRRTSGIGRTLAEAFHDRSNQVIAAGRRQALLDEVTAGRPGMVGLQLDLDDQGSVRRLGAEIHERFPTLNVPVANAGISKAEDMAPGGIGWLVRLLAGWQARSQIGGGTGFCG